MKQVRRAILTVPSEYGKERCWGTLIKDVDNRFLRDKLYDTANEWIETRKKEGSDFIDRDNIHIYGPFASYDMMQAMLSSEDFELGGKALVTEHTDEKSAFSNYLLNAHWTAPRGALERSVV